MMLDKKQIRAIFLFEFKMGRKAAVTTQHQQRIWPRTPPVHTVRWWFQKSCRGDKSLGDEEHSGRPSEVVVQSLSLV